MSEIGAGTAGSANGCGSNRRYLQGQGGFDGRYLAAPAKCDQCEFNQCNNTAASENDASATGTPTDNGGGSYTYTFDVASGTQPAISHGE